MEKYKNELLSIINSSVETQKELFEDEGKSYENSPIKKALDLSKEILTTRFDNELRQYHFDEDKAYDKFIARKNLDYLRIYIEEFLLLDKSFTEIDFYQSVQKEMKNLLNAFHFYIK